MSLACKTRLTRWLTLSSYVGLLLLFSLWYLLLSPAQSDHPWVIWLVHLLPLLAFLPVVIKGSPRGHAWLCFVLLLYFLEAVIAALVPTTRWLGLIESLLLATLFTSAMLYARWRSQLAKVEHNAQQV
ncbi:DUF2069 domain-containing protein [Marinobacterium sp. D7]|uniref:DUF2069 domain-containing protein n=1 Tax=Marinobacterium ramblicola TaxID=2849041 RepID=UPI001C2D6843|nr:DUF2069 domain-containing protein [Marinobacterium ramblicola]MBV1787947.1 DUF2069 domain-containing protein [Marinobacterium ramblicola]